MDYLLLIFPIATFIVLFYKAKIAPLGTYIEDGWDYDTSRSLFGIAAVFIMHHHMTQCITGYGWNYKGPITIFNSIGLLFTSIFFFFSGFGLMVSLSEKKDYMKTFLAHRLVSVLVPFFMTNVFYIPYCMLFTDRIQTVGEFITSVTGFTLMNKNAWFVVEITFLYLAFFVAEKLTKNRVVMVSILTVITVCIIFMSLSLGDDTTRVSGYWFKGAWWYNTTILFPVGLWFGLFKHRVMAFFKRFLIAIELISILVFGILLHEHLRIWQPFYLDSIMCIAFVMILLGMVLKVRIGNPVLRFIGKISYELYLIHGVYLMCFGFGLALPDLPMFAIVFALSFATAALLTPLDKRIIKRMLNL